MPRVSRSCGCSRGGVCETAVFGRCGGCHGAFAPYTRATRPPQGGPLYIRTHPGVGTPRDARESVSFKVEALKRPLRFRVGVDPRVGGLTRVLGGNADE